MTTNMYRVGDYVYFETSSTSPYQIRRIEELNKTPTGNVEAKVMCFYRRRELPHPLVQLADKHQLATTDDSPIAMKLKKMWLKTPITEEQASQTILDPAIAALDEDRSTNTSNSTTSTTATTNSSTTGNNGTANPDSPNSGATAGNNGNAATGTAVATTDGAARPDPLTPKQRNQMKHRELFLSRQVETLPATHIRGKCSVTLLNETESLLSYLNKDDTFFYCLVYDPTQKTLLADKGEIRVGSRYQTDVQPLLRDGDTDAQRAAGSAALETLVWTPQHTLNDRKIDQYLVVSRSVGTFARALDCSSSVKQPSLHMSAAAASRDITLFHAMDTLHQHGYAIETAMCSLVPSSGPVLCRDEMEEWSASEANLFEEALDKYGKDFNDIRQDFLPWKSLKNIVEYYYMWKTTDRYVQQKRVKAVEAESKLKQVYIPNFSKTGGAAGAVAAPGGGPPSAASKGTAVNGNCAPLNGAAAAAAAAAAASNDVITVNGGKPCESCAETSSPHWYAWGPTYLCQTCWTYWKKYGGLKVASVRLAADSELELLNKKKTAHGVTTAASAAASVAGVNAAGAGAGANAAGVEAMVIDDGVVLSADGANRPLHKCSISNCGKEFKVKAHLARHYAQAHCIPIRSGSPRPIMKTRTAFYLHTTGATKLSRRLCRQIIRSKKAARQPSFAINIQAVKQEFATVMTGKQITDIAHLLLYVKRDRGSVTRIANRLGNPGPGPTQDWLILTPKADMPKPPVVSFPKPPKAADGSLMYERIPNKISVAEAAAAAAAAAATATATTSPTGLGDDATSGKGAAAAVAVGLSLNNCAAAATAASAAGAASSSLAATPMDIGADGAANASAAVVMMTGAAAAASAATTSGGGSGAASSSSLHMPAKSSALKRRIYDDSVNGVDRPAVTGPPAKRPNKDPMPSHRPTPEQYAAMMAAAAASGQPMPRHHMNGKPKIAQLSRTGSGRKQVISWTDAPDDVFFRVSELSRRTRRALTVIDLRRAARKPWRPLLHARSSAAVLFPPIIAPPPAAAAAANLLPPSVSANLAADALPASVSAALAAQAAAAAAAAAGLANPASSSAAALSHHLHASHQQPPSNTIGGHLQQHHHHQSLLNSLPPSSSAAATTTNSAAVAPHGLASSTGRIAPSSPTSATMGATPSSGTGSSSTSNDMQVVILD